MAPSRKKTKRTNGVATKANPEACRKNVRGRRGGLKDFMKMPIELTEEICLRLHPRDLLSLSRVNKEFHTFLCKKSSAHLWRRTVKAVGVLPLCPEWFIEPAWISLLYSPSCTNRGGGKAQEVYWVCLARFCATCRTNAFVPVNGIRTVLKQSEYNYFKVLENAAKTSPFLIIDHVTGFKKPCYLKSQVLEVLDAWKELPIHEQSRSSAGDASSWAETRYRFAKRCAKWEQKEKSVREAETQVIMNERLQYIGLKLKELGWGPEAAYLKDTEFTPLAYYKPLWQAKKLTDRVWQNMSGGILERMDGIREARLAHEFQACLTQRWAVMSAAAQQLLDRHFARHPEHMTYGLNIADLALQVEFERIMCEPTEVVVDSAQFLSLEGEMDMIVERWVKDVYKQFRAKVRGRAPRGINPLALATTVFSCGAGEPPGDFRTFPGVAACGHVRADVNAHKGEGKSAYEAFVYRQRERPYVGCAGRLKAVTPNSFMWRIVQMCGKNSYKATAEEMDALDVRFVVSGWLCTNWRGAMQYAAPGNPGALRLATADEAAKAQRIETLCLREHAVWTCTRCGPEALYTPTTQSKLEEHLQAVHGIVRTAIPVDAFSMNRTLASFVIAQHLPPTRI